MIWLLLACSLGLPAGFLLLWRVPLCKTDAAPPAPGISIIIPARNEERNLPRLLESIRKSSLQPRETIVVDDASTDATASIAGSLGARVISSQSLPEGWTGKTWACAQGAASATADAFLFLDADTWFAPDGFEKLSALYAAKSARPAAVSVLPYHQMRAPYEHLSLVFNLLMAFGAGGFGVLGRGRLFGQSMLIARSLYEQCGGHAAVRRAILENLKLSGEIEAAGGVCVCLGGRGVLNIRMFPNGFAQLREGWTKAFADGAAASDPRVLAISIFWLTALCTTCIFAALAPGPGRVGFVVLYGLFALQLAWLARQIGNYNWLGCLLYPVPVFFFFAVFAISLYRRLFRRRVTWRGRSL